MNRYCLLFLPSLLYSCENRDHAARPVEIAATYNSIQEIPAPLGYERMSVGSASFGEWLRKISLKKDKRVYLYDGSLKRNQQAQFAVLNIPVGNKDLQQCADAIMRLRAEYWMWRHMPDSIVFFATNGQSLSYATWRKGTRYKLSGNRLISYQKSIRTGEEDKEFEAYLELVFSYCGTLSLHKQLKPLQNKQALKPGDIWIKPGSPGHAMIVVDVAVNKQGQKMFMLAQSYMPAQDIHIVVNPEKGDDDPWYLLREGDLVTPEWSFAIDQLYSW